jgi:hypothetical protein
METAPDPKPSQFPTFRSCVRAVFSRRSLYALIVLVTLIALYHAEENFRGKRAWERYRQEAEARGVKFDFAAFIPPPIPDEQNAAANRIVREWFPKPLPDDANWPDLLGKAEQRISSRKNTPDRRTTEHFIDLVAMKEALAEEESGKETRTQRIAQADRTPQERAAAALAVLESLKVYQPALDELRAASKRPQVRYPIDYKLDDPFSILLPHLAKIKRIVQTVRLQANANLAAGRIDDAFADVMFMLWLTDSMRGEPFLIDQLVRIACLQITMQPIWEGLAEHKWTDAQLQQLQQRLRQFEFVTDMIEPMGSERAASVGVIHRLARDSRSRPGIADLFDMGNQPTIKPKAAAFLTSLVPRGWFYFEALNYCTLLDGQMKDGFDLQKKTISAPRMEENNARMEADLDNAQGAKAILTHRYFAHLLLPALKNATRKFALGQVMADEAALACALERYRLANGKLPETLDALVPKFMTSLPHDVLNGESLKYKRISDGDFVLSSVGWPISGDGGRRFPPADSEKSKDRPGDWMWHSAP